MTNRSEVETIARRRLRRIRVRDALGETISPEDEALQRNNLLPLVLEAATRPESTSDELPEAVIDATVSVALARVSETHLNRLTALLSASEVLASDQQFARLQQLAALLTSARDDIRTEHPFLAVLLNALQLHLGGRERAARRQLTQLLGGRTDLGGTNQSRTIDNMVELYIAAAADRWLRDGDLSAIDKAARFALRANSGTALEIASFLSAYASAVEDARPADVVLRGEGWPGGPALDEYLSRRGITTLFPAQIRAIESGALGGGSKVLAMPTSSGKTFLAELRIATTLPGEEKRRAIYLAPYRLLARQVERDLRGGLRSLGISVRDVGSAFDISIDELGEEEGFPDVAIMTPERLDALMRLAMSDRRGAREASSLLNEVRLVVFDELHLLGRPGRGPRLELVLTRWRAAFPTCDVFGLSGVVEGVDSLAAWLGSDSITGGRRPTGTIELLWRTDGTIVQRFLPGTARIAKVPRSKTAIADAAELAMRFRDDLQPILILENTRPNAESVARRVHRLGPRPASRWRSNLTEEQNVKLAALAAEAKATFGASHDLPDLIREGIAYHHAGLPPNLLRGIEELAADRTLRVVCATTTVAEGAHLPFQVVIIPHLNFQSGDGRLDKSLYLNVLGRVGRASVAVEGIVVLLDSDSRTLKGYVARSLWNEQERIGVRGQLTEVTTEPSTMEELDALRGVESHVLAWLGDRANDTPSEDQAGVLASATLSGSASNRSHRTVAAVFDHVLVTLEERGLARASSPYRLTETGRRARLAGLGANSCVRLRRSVAEWTEELVEELASTWVLTEELAGLISATVFESEEVLESGLWFRRTSTTESQRTSTLKSLRSGRRLWPYEDPLFTADLAMFDAWLRGFSYAEIGQLAPVFKAGLFKGSDPGDRAADAAEHLGRLAYPAAWTWSAAISMLGQTGEEIPFWIRRSVEHGLPSRVANELYDRVGLSRSGSIAMAQVLDDDWDVARQELVEFTIDDLPLELTQIDLNRLEAWNGG